MPSQPKKPTKRRKAGKQKPARSKRHVRPKPQARPKRRRARPAPVPPPKAPTETPANTLDSVPPLDPPAADPSSVPYGELVDEPAVVRPEVHTLRTQPNGGALRIGNPGNAGGGVRHPGRIRQELRELVTGGGLALLKRTIAREEVDYRAIVVSQGKGVPSEVKVVAVPIDTRVAILAVEIALEASEGKVSPEKPGLTKRRSLEVRVVIE